MSDDAPAENTPDDDDALMARAARHGDTRAFGLLVARYQGRLLRFAARMLGGDADAAQDVVQEAFVRLWTRRADYQPQERLDAFLLRVTRNLCYDRTRRTAFRSSLPLDDCMETASDDPGPDALLRTVLLAQAVREAIADLPDAQRVVFVLSHYESLRYDEIALLLDCPPGTVASRKHHAVAFLRRRLAPLLNDAPDPIDWKDPRP